MYFRDKFGTEEEVELMFGIIYIYKRNIDRWFSRSR